MANCVAGVYAHMGGILEERYNDLGKALELLLGGDIVSLRDDLESTVRESPLDNDELVDRDLKEASCVSDYLLNGGGEYKYLFDKGMWYVVDGLLAEDGISWVLWSLDARARSGNATLSSTSREFCAFLY